MRRWLVLAVVAGCGQGASSSPPPPSPSPSRPPPRPAPDAAVLEADPAVDHAPCPDPQVGLWVGRFFEADHWNEFRISLRRTAGDLLCFEETRWWDAPEAALRPPACPSGGPAWGITRLRCEARVVDDELEVRTVTILSEIHTCGGGTGNYIHDWFHGARLGNTWTTHNRFRDVDGVDVEQPVTFHRLSCTP